MDPVYSASKRGLKVIKRGLKVAASRAKNPMEAAKIMAREMLKGEDASNPRNCLMSFAQQRANRPEQAIIDKVQDLQLEGMHMDKCWFQNHLLKNRIGPSLRAKLLSKRFPEDVVQSIVANAQSGQDYTELDESFVHSPDGESRLVKWAVWVKEVDDDHVQVAFMAILVSFRTSRFIESYTDTRVPEYANQPEYVPVKVAGWLGPYSEDRLVHVRRQTGYRQVREPVYRQHVMQATDIDAIKTYMMYEACSEAVTLCQ